MGNTKQDGYKKVVDHMIILSRNMTILASLLLIFVLLGSTFYLFSRATSTVAYVQASTNDFGRDLEASFMQENIQKEWKRLHKYHGNPSVVIYEERKTPYFFDKQGKKCSFTYPSEQMEQIDHGKEDLNE